MIKKLMDAIESRKDELFKLLGDLIKINSEDFGSYGNELECAQFVKNYLENIGVESDIYSPDSIEGMKSHPDYLDGRALENRPNTTGWIKGTCSDRSVMFAGHSDTVPIGNLDAWSFPPLCGEVRDGKVLGRGACDDKYAIASSLFLMKLLRELDIKLPFDFYFTAYSDEEYGGGNGALAACLKYKCDDFLNLDAGGFNIVNSGVGGGGMQINIEAIEPQHSCALVFDGINMLKDELDQFRERRMAELKADDLYANTSLPSLAMDIMEIRVGDNGNDLGSGFINFEYFTSKTEPEIMAEIDEMCGRLNEKFEKSGLRLSSVDKTTRFFHFTKTVMDNHAMKVLMDSSKAVSGRELVPSGGCLSDLSLFVKYGSPKAFSFGIGRGFTTEGGAHQNNEFIECDVLVEFTKILGTFLLNY